MIIDIIPVFRDAKNDIRSAHINSILQLSQTFLGWFGIDTVVDTAHNYIITLSGKRVRMTPLCSGLMVTSVVSAFIISFPGRSLLYRLRFALVGAIIIYILNIIRVSVIAAQLASNNKLHIDFVQNYHKTVYDTLIYILVLVYIAVYVFRYSADRSKT